MKSAHLLRTIALALCAAIGCTAASAPERAGDTGAPDLSAEGDTPREDAASDAAPDRETNVPDTAADLPAEVERDLAGDPVDTGAAADEGAEVDAGPAVRYLALGDSYTIGESVAEDERYPVQLVARLRAGGAAVEDAEIIARTGWTTSELSRGIDAADPRGPYGLVTLLIGVNNQYRGRPVETYTPEFAALLARAIGFAGDDPARVVVISIPDYGATPFGRQGDAAQTGREIDAYNAAARAEVESAGAHWVDITPESREAVDRPSLVAPDGLHPSGEMYAEWVELMLPPVRRALAQ